MDMNSACLVLGVYDNVNTLFFDNSFNHRMAYRAMPFAIIT